MFKLFEAIFTDLPNTFMIEKNNFKLFYFLFSVFNV
jgi:hypothetical protein